MGLCNKTIEMSGSQKSMVYNWSMKLSERDLAWLSKQLRNMNFLSSCSDEEFDELVLSMETLHVACGQVIIRQGKPAEAVYLISSGTVGIWAEIPNGQKRLLRSLMEGDYFGEVSVLNGGVPNATVIADCDVELFVIPAQKLLATVHKNPLVAERVAVRASRRLGVRPFGDDLLSPEAQKKSLWERALSFLERPVRFRG
jgi:signal-transduction protein with cAMP-binding, CBS, and nucleotidyltransferase domain